MFAEMGADLTGFVPEHDNDPLDTCRVKCPDDAGEK